MNVKAHNVFLICIFLSYGKIFADEIYHPEKLANLIKLNNEEQRLFDTCSFEQLAAAGGICKRHGDWRNALRFLKPAILKSPDNWVVNWDLGDCLLLQEDLRRGMAGFRMRWYHDKKLHQRLWRGESLINKTILVTCQWGLGDTFMFIRYAQILKRMGATIIAVVQKPLKQILSECPYLDTVITSADNIPDYDYQVPLTFLCELLSPTVNEIPQNIPYLFAPASRIDYWRQVLPHDEKLNIGICWHGEDREDPQTKLRPIPLKELVPLFRIPNTRFFSLQQGGGIEQLSDLPADCILHTFDNSFDKEHGAFIDTAAVIKNLDLVISIDTSIAHLSPALGCDTWVLLPFANEWRFFLHHTDSAWFKNVRLFRQPKPGAWDRVVELVRMALIDTYKNRGVGE